MLLYLEGYFGHLKENVKTDYSNTNGQQESTQVYDWPRGYIFCYSSALQLGPQISCTRGSISLVIS